MRHKLWLGKCSKSQAAAVAAHIDQLKICAELGTPIPKQTAQWLSNIGPRITDKLREFGIIGQSSSMPKTLDAFCSAYIAARNDWQPRTVKRMENVKAHLLSQFDASREIATITPGDAQRFARWCRSHFKSQSHSGKIISDSRQFFAAAIDDRLITSNPFSGINASQPHAKDRESYITEETTDGLIDSTTREFGAVIASARYGGLRIPSETLSLKWTDIDWSTSRVTVIDSKRKTVRVVPLFPKWRTALDNLLQSDNEPAEYVFNHARASANKSYRNQLLTLLERKRIKPWPKLWQNLRASRETDLKAQFAGAHHVVHSWIGNSQKVSEKHYDRIHEEHFAQAVR